MTMTRTIKIWLILAASLITLGILVIALGMSFGSWELGTNKYETNSYEINESFGKISINTDTADIVFLPSEDGKCKIDCYEKSNMKHSVSVIDGVLSITLVDSREWYEFIGINFGSTKITLYLPIGEYPSLLIEESTGDVRIPKDLKFESIDISVSTGDVICRASANSVRISSSTGDITLSDMTCEGDLTLSVSTGDVKLSDIACKSLSSRGSTGEINLTRVIASDKLYIERSTGDVELDASDAKEIYIETDTGDVEGSLASGKDFYAESDTGDVRVPSSTDGGRCEIKTDTGDIKITVKAN